MSLLNYNQEFLDLLPVGVYACLAPNGVILFRNRRAAELWGRDPRPGDPDERFCGSMRMFLPDGTPLPHDQCPMASAVKRGESTRNGEVIVERPDGTRVKVYVNISPVRNAYGDVVGAVNVFSDAPQ